MQNESPDAMSDAERNKNIKETVAVWCGFTWA
jgi:hypothetical protein